MVNMIVIYNLLSILNLNDYMKVRVVYVPPMFGCLQTCFFNSSFIFLYM